MPASRTPDEANLHTPHGPTHTHSQPHHNTTLPHDQHINHHSPDLTTTPPEPTTTQYTTSGYTSLPLPTLSQSDIRVLPSPSIIGNPNGSCSNMFFTATWNLLSILICLIPMSTFLCRKRKHISNRRRHVTWKRRHYPLASPTGIRSKYGTTNTEWNIVYDPTNDNVLVWTNHRVRIYRRRGCRLFAYQKSKSENTFPRHALPISGEWQGSKFIVTNNSHWTNPPTAIPPHYCATPLTLPTRIVKPMKPRGPPMETHVITGLTPIPVHRRKPRPWLKSPSPKKQQQRKKKVSCRRHTNWQTHARQTLPKCEPRHLAAKPNIRLISGLNLQKESIVFNLPI
jgi:hypothetical protein